MKTSLAPGSQVVTDYLNKAGLTEDLDALGFNLVGYGCTTCIGNSGPLPEAVSAAIAQGDLVATSGALGQPQLRRPREPGRAGELSRLPAAGRRLRARRLDERRHHQGRRSATTTRTSRSICRKSGRPRKEISETVRSVVTAEMFATRYSDVFKGDEQWQKIKVEGGATYGWPMASTYVQNPPYFEGMTMTPEPVTDVEGCEDPRAVRRLDHDRPHLAGRRHLGEGPGRQVPARPPGSGAREFNSYGARRGNHEVMMRGTFANIRIKNHMVPGVEGGVTAQERQAGSDLRRGDGSTSPRRRRW